MDCQGEHTTLEVESICAKISLSGRKYHLPKTWLWCLPTHSGLCFLFFTENMIGFIDIQAQMK